MAEKRLIEQLAREMALENASDLVLVSGYPPMIRVYSQWREMGEEILEPGDCERLCTAMLTESQRSFFLEKKELDFGYHVEHLRFRVNLHCQNYSAAAAMRLIPADVPSYETLNLPKTILEFCDEISGLVLVTGPTGSGKTTTQAAMIDYINSTQRKHIITVEDPVEYLHPTNKKSIVEQREIGEDTHSFANSLRHVLRQAPDVILVGEMRDLETVSTAITAAETGHLVISTLHTNDTVQSIDRMIDIFPPAQQNQVRYQLSLTLKGVIAQILIPRNDRPGSIPAIEILKATPAVRNLIRQSKSAEIYSLIELGKQYGMQTMRSSLEDLLSRGIISKVHVKRALQDLQSAEREEKALRKSAA